MSYNGENIATAQADGNKEESDNFALKILVSNKDAGSIIGKGGATINQLQVDSGARVKLSQSHELFPGTSDRIVLLTGSFDAVIKAHTMIMRKLHEPDNSESAEPSQASSAFKQCKLVVPNAAAGGIIGKAGSNIRAISDESQARVQLSPHTPGLSERIVTITGSLEQLLHAVSLVVGKMQEDPAYYTYPSVNSAPPPAFGIYGRGHNYHGMAGPLPSLHAGMGLGLNPRGLGGPSTSQTQITVAVPDALIGAIVGRAGRTITELQAYSGARIKISQRGEFVPGTTNRLVTITGHPNAVTTAQFLVTQKVQEFAEVAQNQQM